ncbi:MAG TPA: BsuPI-related putative proteinase inhibitor [Actinomycetota bacterium]|nr:BsuPI-related putative proteinase inhibitor [Actinomycetota bacterium]
MRVSTSLALIALTGLLLFPVSAEAKSQRCTREDLSMKLSLDRKSYPPGEPVKMRFIVKNISGEPCRVVFPNGRKATFEILNDEGVVRDDSCQAYTQAIEEQEWAADHREVYRFRWGQRRTPENCEGRGVRAGPGSYSARALFDGARSGTVKTKRVPFIIGD